MCNPGSVAAQSQVKNEHFPAAHCAAFVHAFPFDSSALQVAFPPIGSPQYCPLPQSLFERHSLGDLGAVLVEAVGPEITTAALECAGVNSLRDRRVVERIADMKPLIDQVGEDLGGLQAGLGAWSGDSRSGVPDGVDRPDANTKKPPVSRTKRSSLSSKSYS